MQEGVTLRPLGVGDIVDRVIGIYRARPVLFLAISAIPYLILVLVVGALSVVFASTFARLAPLFAGDVAQGLRALEALAPDLIAFAAIVIVVALATSLVQSAALVNASAARYLGRETTVGDALRVGLSASPRLLLMGLAAFAAFCAMWAVLLIAVAIGREWYVVVGGIGAGFVGMFYLAASWMVSPAVATLEGTGPIASLQRSWRLSQGNRWRILGLIALLFMLQVVLSSILSIVLVASFATDETVQVVLQQMVNLVATIAWAPIYWGTFAVLYYDLRVRKEAFDLELAAEALPRAT